MSEHDPQDPWASLAESLGAAPSSEPSPPRPAQPARPAARPRTEPKPRPATPAGGDWDALASDLGVAGSPAETPRPAPPRHEGGDRSPRAERSAERPAVERVRHDHDDEVAPRSHAAGGGERREEDGEDRGERRGRRRRGRRGGRGRGRREGDRVAGAEPRGDVGDRRPGGQEMPPRNDLADEPRDAADAFGAGAEGDAFAADVFAPAADADRGREGEPRAEGRREGRDREDRPRRRRGRRGGRSRSGGEAVEGGAGRESGERRDRLPARGAADGDDEPLPAGYGVRPAAPRSADTGTRGEGEPARSGDSEGEGDGRGRRRRRRRRGGEGRSGSGRESGSRAESGRGSRGSRGRRAEGGLRSSSSTLSRGRRADFAPVAGGYDEDDEGLEFLGIEEAGREPQRREPRPQDDELFAESGLDQVRDVPSWVEAIGIVIAGNLDARSRGRGGEGGRR